MKKVFFRTTTVVLTIAMLLSTALPVFAETPGIELFEKSIIYTPGQFRDVDENQWYGANNQQSVELACQLGLMKGSGDKFEPNGNVTLAQAITMAARLNAIYNGWDGQFVQGQTWYQVYVDYCIKNGIIDVNDFPDYYKSATRAQMAYIFSNALPETEFEEINNVEALPDFSVKSTYGKEAFLLYKAGIIGGNDSLGTFTPNAYISRAAVAAIIARVALPQERLAGLSFVRTSQEPEGEVADYTQNPDLLWEYYYTPGTEIDSVDQLKWILMYAAANLIPDFRINISTSVFNDLLQFTPDGMYTFAYSFADTNYSGAYYNINITPQYSIYGEVRALLSSDMAWDYASDDAVNYYYAIQYMLTTMGTSGKTDRDKAILIHNYIVRNYQYDLSLTRYTVEEFIDTGSAVCQAYAQLFSLLGNMSGVQVHYLMGMGITGPGTSAFHAWNSVILDGYWYYVDTTWDDPPYPDGGYNGTIRKDYLLITRAQMDKDHILQYIDGFVVE